MRIVFLPDFSTEGSIIRLSNFDLAEAAMLMHLIGLLGNGSIDAIQLSDVFPTNKEDACGLTFRIGAINLGIRPTFDSDEFECVLTRSEWKNVAGLIEPFCNSAEEGRFTWLDNTSGISLLLSPNGKW